MDYTKLFYWLTVADNARSFFVAMVIIFTAIAGISTIAYIINGMDSSDDGQEMSRKWMWKSYPWAILFWLLLIGTPAKKDALLIIAGGQTLNFLSQDSIAKQIPSELSSFVLLELKNMAKETQIELGIQSQKEKIIESAKKMTTEELLNKIQADSIFAKTLFK